MRRCIFSLLINLWMVPNVWAHGVTPEQRIDRLHVRIIQLNATVDMLIWLAVAAYVTTAVVAAAACAVWARHSWRHAWMWFVFGLLLPIVAPIFVLVRTIQDRKPVAQNR